MKPIAVILAGGKGTRFAPFATNKTMWPLCGKVMLQHTIELVLSAGLDEIVVVCNQENEGFVKQYQTVSPNLQYRLQKEALGMDDALKLIADLISRRAIVVLNAVDYFEANLIKRIVEKANSNNYKMVVGGYKTNILAPAGYYKIEHDTVTGVVEKPSHDNKPSDVLRLVTDFYQDATEFIELFDQFENDTERDKRYEMAQDVLLRKYGAAIEYSSYWTKLKYPHFVLDVKDAIFSHSLSGYIHPTARISPHAIIEGVVSIDEGAQIEAGAIIKGPAYIGKRVIVGNNTLVRQSMIEEGATIGFGSEIARSYIGPDCQIHHSFVGDSVLEKAVNMSWGTVTANLRLDRKNVLCRLPDGTKVETSRQKLGAIIAKEAFLGVNASTMPGACITPNTRILPNQIVK